MKNSLLQTIIILFIDTENTIHFLLLNRCYKINRLVSLRYFIQNVHA